MGAVTGFQDAPLTDGSHQTDRSFEVTGPVTVLVSVDFGRVRVNAHDALTARVRIRPTSGRPGDTDLAQQVRVELVGDTLEVRLPSPGGLRRWFSGKPGSADLEIDVPQGSSLRAETQYADVVTAGRLEGCTVHTSGGGVRIDETGQLEVENQYGGVTVRRVTGTARATSTHAGLRIDEVAGSANLTSGSGDVSIATVSGEVSARTAYGTIDIRELRSGRADLSTSYGAVTVGIATGTAAYLDLRSDHGRVFSELPGATEPGPGIERAAVRARTSYGEITIRRS